MSAHMENSPTNVCSRRREAWAGVKAAGAWQPVFLLYNLDGYAWLLRWFTLHLLRPFSI